jgi:hypothetical protein
MCRRCTSAGIRVDFGSEIKCAYTRDAYNSKPTELISPWSRVFEKLIVIQLFKKFLPFIEPGNPFP